MKEISFLPDWWEALATALDTRIITLGESQLTLGKILYVALLIALIFWLTSRFRRYVIRFLSRSQMDQHASHATGTIASYIFLLVGLMVILQAAGVDLTTLNVIAGAVGVGIGLGLQEVANNFISGLIILFEKPIKVGDRIEVGSVHGDVVEIRARSTTVVTNENIKIIVPNSKVITENVVNWTGSDPKIRFHIPVGVAYGSDPRVVEQALVEAARSVGAVLDDPEPGVWFTEFGDSSLNFEVRAWTKELLHNRGTFISNINFAIHDKLAEHGISVPFPQRDVHFKSGKIRVVVEKE